MRRDPSDGLTRELATTLVDLATDDLPARSQRAAERSLLNVLATAIGACRHPAVDILVDVGRTHGGDPRHPLPGRPDHLDALHACCAIGVAAHVDDFDDTHLASVIHPGAAVLGPAWALGAERSVPGGQVLRAVALGIEAQLRLGLAMSPWHYDDGWHITGTCGTLGSVITSGLIMGLDADHLAQAIGTAASQTLGQREAFGTMIKGFHSGKAASNGLLAARLAEQGFTGPDDVLENDRGFFRALSPSGATQEQVLDGFGDRWELEANTFKPYPCGIVSHPAIDAAITLSHRVDIDAVDVIEATVHPLVIDLAGNLDPTHGLAARFSTPHGIAAGLIDGQVGLATYTDERVRAADTTALRSRIRLHPNDDLERDAATLRITLSSGQTIEEHVAHARGSLARPLTDDELRAKVEGLVEPVLPGRTGTIVEAVAGLDQAPSTARLVSACLPEAVPA